MVSSGDDIHDLPITESVPLQTGWHTESARLECHFALFWEAEEVSGSFQGALTKKRYLLVLYHIGITLCVANCPATCR